MKTAINEIPDGYTKITSGIIQEGCQTFEYETVQKLAKLSKEAKSNG